MLTPGDDSCTFAGDRIRQNAKKGALQWKVFLESDDRRKNDVEFSLLDDLDGFFEQRKKYWERAPTPLSIADKCEEDEELAAELSEQIGEQTRMTIVTYKVAPRGESAKLNAGSSIRMETSSRS